MLLRQRLRSGLRAPELLRANLFRRVGKQGDPCSPVKKAALKGATRDNRKKIGNPHTRHLSNGSGKQPNYAEAARGDEEADSWPGKSFVHRWKPFRNNTGAMAFTQTSEGFDDAATSMQKDSRNSSRRKVKEGKSNNKGGNLPTSNVEGSVEN